MSKEASGGIVVGSTPLIVSTICSTAISLGAYLQGFAPLTCAFIFCLSLPLVFVSLIGIIFVLLITVLFVKVAYGDIK